MASNKYPLGEGVIVPMLFEVYDDPFVPSYVPYDPIVPSFKLEAPGGLVLPTFTFPASPEIFRHSPARLGKYWIVISPIDLAVLHSIDLLGVGTWRWKWFDPNPSYPGVKEGSFVVTSVKIP